MAAPYDSCQNLLCVDDERLRHEELDVVIAQAGRGTPCIRTSDADGSPETGAAPLLQNEIGRATGSVGSDRAQRLSARRKRLRSAVDHIQAAFSSPNNGRLAGGGSLKSSPSSFA